MMLGVVVGAVLVADESGTLPTRSQAALWPCLDRRSHLSDNTFQDCLGSMTNRSTRVCESYKLTVSLSLAKTQSTIR